MKQSSEVLWRFGVDSHTDLLLGSGLQDDTADPAKLSFARVEIVPKNGNYLFPDEWDLHVDQSITPTWFGALHRAKAREAHDQWLKELNKILVRKQIVNPFKIAPPKTITARHIDWLRKWGSVRASVRDSVWGSVRDSVRDSVGDSVWASVRDSVGASVGASVWASVRGSVRASVRASVWASVWASVRVSVRDSVGDSVWAYVGSFYILPVWKHPRGKYPFAPGAELWEQGLVPSFDGKTWRLHGGSEGKVLFEIGKEDLFESEP